MLSKCANPTCSTPLVYLREGKVFMMEHDQSKVRSEGPVLIKPKAVSRVEHFWLCGPCSAELTLIYDQAEGVKVTPKVKTLARRAAAS